MTLAHGAPIIIFLFFLSFFHRRLRRFSNWRRKHSNRGAKGAPPSEGEGNTAEGENFASIYIDAEGASLRSQFVEEILLEYVNSHMQCERMNGKHENLY